MIPHTGLIAGLAVRDSEITVALGEYSEGEFAVIALGRAETTGMCAGLVLDSHGVTAAMAQAVDEAELMSGREITSLRLAISGPHLSSAVAFSAVNLGRRDRVVTEDDERRVVEAAVAAMPPGIGRASLQILVQDFIVEGQNGLSHPAGLTSCTPLEANVLMVTCSTAAKDALIACVHMAGPRVADTVAAPLAAGAVLLNGEQRELGVALVDFDRDSIGVAVFERGSLWYLRAAERSGLQPDEGSIDWIRTAIVESGCAARLYAGLVLTSSGALTPGLPQRLAETFDTPVTVGSPTLAGPYADAIDGSAFASALGLLILERPNRAWGPLGAAQRTGGWGSSG